MSRLVTVNGATPGTPDAGKLKWFSNTSKQPAVVNDAGSVVVLNGQNALTQSQPANPTGTTDLVNGVMMGLAGSITPTYTGRVLFIISGNLTNSTATAGDGAKAQIRYGSGTAPTNGAAVTGTLIGTPVTSVLERATANDLQPFCCQAIVTGLTVGTAYWIDIDLTAIVGGTALVKNVSISALEI